MFSSNACKESNEKVLEWFWWNYVWFEWKHHQPDFGWKCHLTQKPRPPFLDSFGLLFNSTYCSFLRFNVTLSTLSPNPYFTPSSQLPTFMHFQFLNVHSQFFFSTCSLQNTFKSASRTISVMKMFHKKSFKKNGIIPIINLPIHNSSQAHKGMNEQKQKPIFKLIENWTWVSVKNKETVCCLTDKNSCKTVDCFQQFTRPWKLDEKHRDPFSPRGTPHKKNFSFGHCPNYISPVRNVYSHISNSFQMR